MSRLSETPGHPERERRSSFDLETETIAAAPGIDVKKNTGPFSSSFHYWKARAKGPGITIAATSFD